MSLSNLIKRVLTFLKLESAPESFKGIDNRNLRKHLERDKSSVKRTERESLVIFDPPLQERPLEQLSAERTTSPLPSVPNSNLPQQSTNRIVKHILGINFVFDKNSYKLFSEEFANEGGWEISYDDQGCYLVRRKKNGYFEYFHRWLMKDEIEKFAKKMNLLTRDVIVHHRNHQHTDNRVNNLALVTREDHHTYHRKERAYEKWRGSRQEFEKWWFVHHKD